MQPSAEGLLPTGRERAIETLIDSEANGACYRAARILDEVVPHALANRPNLMTRSALVEQAHALVEYEVDSAEKYKEAFGVPEEVVGESGDSRDTMSTPKNRQNFYQNDEDLSDRILRHHDKICASAQTPFHGRRLVSTLQHLYSPESLLPSVLKHDALLETTNFSSDNEQHGILEGILGTVCRDLGEDDSLHGLLLATISVLTCLDGPEEEQQQQAGGKSTSMSNHSGHNTTTPEQRDPTAMPALQVGAILSLLQTSSSGGPFALDESVLQYLGQAAAVHEERMEIQKARLLARMQQESKDEDDDDIIPVVPPTPSGASASAIVEDDDVEEVAKAEVDDGDEEEEEDDDDDDDDDDLPGDDSALTAAVFDQIISAVTGGDDDMSLDGVDRAALRLAAGGLGDSSDDDEEDSDEDDDSDEDPHHLQQRYGEDAPHVEDESSSDPEAADDDDEDDEDDDDDDEPQVEEEDDDDDDDDENEGQAHGSILRQALALSLADHSGFAAPEISSGNDDDDEEEPEDDEDGLVTPRRQSSASSSRKSGESNDDPADGDEPLPELPQPPAHYPYWSAVETVADVDERKDPAENLHPCLDPACLSRFGSIPASYTIVRLLQNALLAVTTVTTSKEEKGKPSTTEPGGFKANPVPGGMGCTLFGSEPHLFSSSEHKDKDSDDEVGSSAVSVQLLVAVLLLFFDARKDAIEGLRAAVLAEQRNAQGDSDEEQADDEDDIRDGNNDTPLSDDEEEDISVAMGMTLNYPSGNAASVRSSQAESLESKGMTRKAAAAGWDAAMRIKSLKKNTDAWKNRVKLYSYCTLLSMKCFRTYVQFCVAERLDVQINSAEETGSTFLNSVKRVIPAAVSSKLSDALSALLSVSEFRALVTLVSGDDAGEVEELFMPLNLYREALATWGESVPLLHPSPANRELILRNLIKDCFSKAQTVHHFGSFDTIFSLPSSEDESQLYKLDILCRRFCVTDLLDDIVSRPLCFNPELNEADSDDDDTKVAVGEPKAASTLVSLLYSSSLKTSGACLRFLRRLNMAICHRCNVRGILWDGLYACSQFEADEVSNLPASTAGAEAIRVSTNPSSSLLFDSTKCSDSIAILASADTSVASNGSSAHQRASKVWGTVISASFFSPKSGVHRWAVRLDRCERGHVFVGVATTQASMRTYVGGDKYGWGVIGTQALWHDRRKIRGDYGATFRTGSVIVVTLDTDAGTLSFSSWKDTNTSAGSFSLDPLFPGLASPRRQASGGGALEEWGVAFEGLPLDAKLYPAVGLYQRDDRVTLLGVESGGRPGGPSAAAVDSELFAGGTGYFPRLREPIKPSTEEFASQMTSIRKHNDFLSWDSIGFVDSMLTNVVNSIASGDASQRNLSLHTILPSVASSICLLPPSIPVLSARFALHLLPKLTDCIHSLDAVIESEQRLFPRLLKGGKWVIRATGSSGSSVSSEFEEYVVNFDNKLGGNGEFVGFLGNGIGTTGKSKNGVVSIVGTMHGSAIHFVEEWTDGAEESSSSSTDEASSSCVVSARLSLDGFKFEGTYRNVQYGTTGHIAALCLSEGDAPPTTETSSTKNDALRCQSLLRLAHGHLATILGNDVAADHSPRTDDGEFAKHNTTIRSFLPCAPFCEGLQDANGELVEKTLATLRDLYDGGGRTSNLLQSDSFATKGASEVIQTSAITDAVSKIDDEMASRNGGKGSLHSLCPEAYTKARLAVVASLIHHCSLHANLATPKGESLDEVWRTALMITESQVRVALSDESVEGSSTKERSAERCRHVVEVSNFLLSLQPNTEPQTVAFDVSSCLSVFYASVRSKDDLVVLDNEFTASRRRACLKVVALQQLEETLPASDAKLDLTKTSAIECTSVAIPRILGRGWPNKVDPPSRDLSGPMDIGNHYLSGLPGAGHALRSSVRSSVHSILANLGNVMKQVRSLEIASDQDSALLSILPVFACSIRPNDIESVVVQSNVLESLSHILSHHRDALRTICSPSRTSIEADKSLLVDEMNEIVGRDVSRAVIHAATSVSHAIAYQLTQWNNTISLVCTEGTTSDALDQSVSFLIDELKDFVPFMEMVLREDLDAYLVTQGQEQYSKWAGLSMPESDKSKKKKTPVKAGRSSLSHLLERGTLVMPRASTATPTKSGSKASVATSATASGGAHSDKLTLSSGMACQNHLSRCLDILNCLTRSPEALRALVRTHNWLDVMLAPVGVSFERDVEGKLTSVEMKTEGSNVPARYRARMVRFLPKILSNAAADDFIVDGLFMLAGLANGVHTNSLYGDESLVAAEATACLRGLYSVNCLAWRTCIDNAIARNAGSTDVSSGPLVTGILAFVGGSIRTLKPGSHVLLKPAAAAPLSPDAQSAPSSKSGSGSGSTGATGGVTSHHVVGTGTEGIVAGLCRADAGAGVVSSVDMKTGICEVILVERSNDHRLSLNHQRSLTVRALRSPLAEVAQAEQIPLALGSSFPVVAFLKGTLPSALALLGEASDASATDNTVVHQQGRVSPYHKSLLALRAAIVLLSDDRILQEFSASEGCRDVLSSLLGLAGKEKGLSAKVAEAAKLESLASLPVHEGKFNQYVRMLAELQVRQSMVESTTDEVWNTRASECRALGNRKAISEGEMAQDLSEGSQAASRSESLGGTSSARESEAPGAGARGGIAPSRRTMSQSSVSSNSTEDEEENEAAATAAAHLREAAIAQMAELGLPRSWSELALRRTGGTNIEAAVHFCLERGGDMERLLAEERERERMMQRSSTSSRRRGNRSERSSQLLRQLLEMGFPSRWCAEALAATQNNVDEALTWILTNGERLSAEDEGMEDEDDADEDFDDDEDDDEDEDEDEDGEQETPQPDDEDPTGQQQDTESTGAAAETPEGSVTVAQEETTSATSSDGKKEDSTPGWCGSVTPLRFISGRSIINPKTLSISGLPTGGFSSVGTKGVLLTSGKWYYEAILETAGCLQIGWADGSFSGHCHAERGDGCGDGPSSWAYDGWRRYRWHASATEWGCRWREGDVVGCIADIDNKSISFTLNGKSEEVGMGVAFSGQGFRPCGGVYACVSFNRKEKLRLILGGKGTEPFKYGPPEGFRGVGEAVLESVAARDKLLSKESILNTQNPADDSDVANRFLCDFSDGEHGHELFAWQHRYYGSDASVHLGSGRSAKPSGGSVKSPSGSGATTDISPLTCVSISVEKEWKSKQAVDGSNDQDSEAHSEAKMRMSEGFQFVAKELGNDAVNEALLLGIMYARKLILHLIITFGKEFSLGSFDGKGEIDAALDFWRVIDTCVSLRSAGWVGEAGAMAVAAEALGLGISSTEHQSRSQLSERPGVSSIVCGDETILLPVAGISQLLSTIVIDKTGGTKLERETWRNLAACAEASIGADGGGGPLVFLQQGLQSALCKSKPLRDVLISIIRRSVRLLAVVDYSGDDSSAPENPDEDDMDSSSKRAAEAPEAEESTRAQQPDARLTCFLTGLLLSAPVQACISDKQALYEDILEAWSVGLLSASAPWRMVCALSASGILNECPAALEKVLQSISTVSNFYRRLPNTVLRRVWAERAATPVCSRYVQALIELLASVRRAEPLAPSLAWGQLAVDAATPLPLDARPFNSKMMKETVSPNWEWDEGWVANDAGWEVWIGTVECMAVDWKAPSRSAVRTLMDGGDGPPMLREGCSVLRGLDWEESTSTGDEDGKTRYESEKADREKEKKALEEQAADDPAEPEADTGDVSNDEQPDPATSEDNEDQDAATPASTAKSKSESGKKKKRKRIPNPKLPTGTVLSVEPWNGIPAMARRVRWNLTGEEGIYRYGGDGGRFDICHVEVNEKGTRIRKRHPLPESAEQCAARHGFGSGKKHSVLLRLRRLATEKEVEGEIERHHEGVLEWPDFGAGAKVNCIQYPDGAVLVQEKELLFGSKDSGWEARFGEPSYKPGTEIMLSPTGSSSLKDMVEVDARSSFMSAYQELLGSTSYTVKGLRNRIDASKVKVTLEMKMLRGRRPEANVKLPPSLAYTARPPPPMCFDRDYHASSMSLSRDCRTLTCISPDGRGTAFASVGFTKGVHYWEVKLEQADIGSVFIGVAEKPNGSSASGGSAYGDSPPRLNRWLGWGFVNFRATYTAGAERVYGAHCHNEDTVGVLLDCDAGRVSFFYDGMKYGEHILNDLGCAFENISPFGFNADGCGSGGAGQGAPSGIEGGRGGRYPAHGVVRPRALWPVIGLRNPGDRITMSSKWSTSGGIDAAGSLKNVLAVDEVLTGYCNNAPKGITSKQVALPDWFVKEAFDEYSRWYSQRWYRTTTRGSGPHSMATFGLDIELDSSPLACAAACASIGLRRALLAGDRVVVKRSAGRPLELAEEAVVLGAHQCRLYYRIVAQKSEGGSLMEGGGRAWFWDESEVVGDSLQLVGEGRSGSTELPLIDRFRCLSSGGIKIVYEGGAVVRSDLEIIDRSSNLGSIPHESIVPRKDVLERRVNSCGVIRYRIQYEGVGEGWISSRIRGGKEESIVEAVFDPSQEKDIEQCYRSPEEAALAWYEKMKEVKPDAVESEDMMYKINDLEEFKGLLLEGQIQNKSALESDAIVATLVSTIADFSEDGDAVDCSFGNMVSAVKYAVASSKDEKVDTEAVSAGPNQAAAAVLAAVGGQFLSETALLARIALLRALNRRVRKALPWLSARPSQEGTAILGGLCGQGASVERAGRSKLVDSMALWVQVPCIASRVRSLRSLIFSSVKLEFLEGVTHATTTPTPLSHDEYELPREIRTVRVNRLKARRAMAGVNGRLKRKHSVFSQLQNETRSWGGAALRRGFVAKGHGGQKRAFKVKLIGEGVNDYSGPYREVFTDAIHEVLEINDDGRGSLGVLDPTPNNASQIGDDRELFMFSSGERKVAERRQIVEGRSEEEERIRKSFSSLTMARDESSREVEESLVFLGRLVGTACRHGIPVDLPLPMSVVWSAVAEEPINSLSSLREVDLLASKNADGSLLWWQQRMLNSFVDGMSHLLPVELLPILSGEELRAMLCGNPDVDVDLLKQVVEYEGYEETDDVVSYFWEALREMSNADRKKFLQFVWARNRLPNKASDFDAPFKIMKGGGDDTLPSASTCFFSLTLPEYSSKEILKEKLTFAFENVCTMESDYVTNDAEVGEGWRGV